MSDLSGRLSGGQAISGSLSGGSTLRGGLSMGGGVSPELLLDKADVITDTASGSIVSIPDGMASPVLGLSVDIEPIQSGTGDPSPDNIRPISGRSEVNVYVEETYDAQATPKATIQLGQTVYGGTVDVTEGKLTIDGELEVFDQITDTAILSAINGFYPNSGTASTLGDYTRISFSVRSEVDQSKYNRISSSYSTKMCNMAKHYFAYFDQSTHWYRNTVLYVFLPTSLCGSTAQSVYDYLVSIKDTNPLSLYIPLATPVEVTLTAEELDILFGENNIWSDASSVSCTYRADTRKWIEKKLAQLMNT